MSRHTLQALGTTRVLALPGIENVNAPQIGELYSPLGVDLTCDLTNRGLNIGRRDVTRGFTPWLGNHERELPVRWRTSVSLQSGVPEQCCDCPVHGENLDADGCNAGALWEISEFFRCPVALVVRRGCDVDVPWAAGQQVEVIRGKWGVRDIVPVGDGPPLFSVAINVIEEAGFDPRLGGPAATARVVPGTTPLPCGISLCIGDTCDSPQLACTDLDGNDVCLVNEVCTDVLTTDYYDPLTTEEGDPLLTVVSGDV